MAQPEIEIEVWAGLDYDLPNALTKTKSDLSLTYGIRDMIWARSLMSVRGTTCGTC